MDLIIPFGQKNTLGEYMILSGADNRPPMLDKELYDSWKSIMELYMQNREHERMILESVEHGPLIWPTVEENGVTRTKKYVELSVVEKIQADYDMKVTSIILQGDDPIACLNKAMAFITVVASSRCGSPVDGLYCRHCALLRKKLKEVWFTICDEHKFFQDFLNTSESSNDDSNVVNMPQEPVVFNQNPGENSLQGPPQIDHHCCYGCGNSLDGIFCQRCTCKSCGKGAHYGYNCLPKVLIISNPEPCHDQNVEEFPQTLPTWLQQQKDQVCQKIPLCYDDDDDEESFIPLRDIIIFELPLCIAITPILSTEEPKDSLIVRDEYLITIPEKESNKFIKSSVENLVPNPNLDFDTKTYLFGSLLNRDTLMASSPKFDSLLEDFSGELANTDLIPPGINEANYDLEEDVHLVERLLYNNSSPRPPEEFNSKNSNAIIESFSPSPIPVEDSGPFIEEIDLFLASDGSIPLGIDNDYSDSERDNLFLERLHHDDPIPLPDILDFSNVIRVFLPFFTYPVTSLILLSSGSEDTIFDPGISNCHFSSLEPSVSHRSGTFMKFNVYPNHLNESSMEILSSACFLMDQ
uniref:CCHC-type domain-containing protein n=1 Tax=Tanacetum cinerariifolium TaxID=118510 RepID=A0A6L2M7P8_TANCI|nr:hypothetical protein [Tanacetum cinerariifolium]